MGTYRIQLWKCDTSRGAPMGRTNKPVTGKCRLQRVPIPDGYDKGGAYWGLGEPLYVCEDLEGHQFLTRAITRNQAKANIRMYNENVTFYK